MRAASTSIGSGSGYGWKTPIGRPFQSADSGTCSRCACRRTAWKIRRRVSSSSWPCSCLQVGETVLVRQRRLLRQLPRARGRDERVREVRLVVPGRHVAQRRPEDRIVARADEMQRPAHHRRLDHVAAEHRLLERLPSEAGEPRPEPDVRGGRPLRLHPGEPLDRGDRIEPLPLEQQLPRQRGAVQLPQGQHARRHGRFHLAEPGRGMRRSVTDAIPAARHPRRRGLRRPRRRRPARRPPRSARRGSCA